MTNVRHDSVWADPVELTGAGTGGQTRFGACVVGAGIAGLSAAYHLTRAGVGVIVLDDGPVGGGQTCRTTAHLASALDDRFSNLESVRGKDAARVAAEAHSAAIDAIEEACRRESIDCDFRRIDGYLVPADKGHETEVRREADAARRAGMSVEEVSAPLPTLQGPALRFARQGRFEPMKYLAGLARAIRANGGVIRTGVHVTAVTDGSPCTVETADGQTITADAVVVATNAPINDRVTMYTKMYSYMTYVVGFEVPPGAVPDCLIWDTLDPYHYVRWSDDRHIIVGGEDHRVGQAHDQEERYRGLEEWTRKVIPQAGAVTHRWGGEVQETPDGLGYIGRNVGEQNVYIATGDSGMGMTHGTIAGLLVTDLITGKENAWAPHFDPARKPPLKTWGEYASENAGVAAHYGKWVTGGEVSSIDEIPPGGGAVVRQGLTKVAVYRDESGETHSCSAVCPHLHAIVTWNPTEKTWDCPAHGSRFDCRGHVINGPANRDLTPLETREAIGSR